MRLFVLTTSLILSTLLALGQNCEPDMSVTVPGYYTSAGANKLATAIQGQFYSDTITILAPTDTLVASIPFTIDSIILQNVRNLPNGLSYATKSNTVIGGGYGCAKVEGTPNDVAGDYTVLLDVKAFIRGLPAADLTVDLPMFLDWPANAEEHAFDDAKVTVTPNPVNGKGNINMSNYRTGVANFSLFNVIGEEVYHELYNLDSQFASVNFDVTDLPNGIYTYQLIIDGQTKMDRLVISNN